jgi:hypothetical protein
MRFIFFGVLLLLNAVKLFAAPVPSYDVRGVAIHQCSCPSACSCMFENPPMKCALVAVYHINSGQVGGVDVSGLSFISIDGDPPVGRQNRAGGVVYLDARATLTQRRALLAILRDHGEWPGSERPVLSVPILFTPTATGYNTVVPGCFRGLVTQSRSRTGTALTVDGVGFAEGEHWIVGRSLINRLHDADVGIRWNLPADTNGSWTLLHWKHS